MRSLKKDNLNDKCCKILKGILTRIDTHKSLSQIINDTLLKKRSIHLLNNYFVKAMFNKYKRSIFNLLLLSFVEVSVDENRRH